MSDDIDIDGWCWLDVDAESIETDDGKMVRAPDERWCVLRAIGEGGSPHHGPCMPWEKWVELARAILAKHGASVTEYPMVELRGNGLMAGSRMSVVVDGDRWRGISPRNGRFASCEGTLAEVIGLAHEIVSFDDAGNEIARKAIERRVTK